MNNYLTSFYNQIKLSGLTLLAENLLLQHGLTQYDLISLAGGMPLPFNQYFEVSINIASDMMPVAFKVEINTPEYYAVRIINLSDKEIVNNFLLVYEDWQNKNIGLNILHNQVVYCLRQKITKITVTALGGKNCPDMNGYYTWGRTGFIIAGSDLIKFKALMFEFEREEKNLAELLSTKEGRLFWKENGETFFGEFDTTSLDSENIKILNKYLIEKGYAPIT